MADKKPSDSLKSGAKKTAKMGKKAVKMALEAVEKGLSLKVKLIAIAVVVGVILFLSIIVGFTAQLNAVMSGSKKAEKEIEKTFSFSLEVLKYRKDIIEFLQANELDEKHVPYVFGIMEISTQGKGGDPMLSSLFEANKEYPKKPGGIQNPFYSLFCGVNEYAKLIKLLDIKDPTKESEKMLLAYQAYHVGRGFINFSKGVYTSDTAGEYIKEQKLTYKRQHFAYQVAQMISSVHGGMFSFIYPLETYRNIDAPFGRIPNPFTGATYKHNGLDFSIGHGTPILASADGVVVFAGFSGDWGNYIKVEHTGRYTTGYAHCSSLAVKDYQHVKKGQVIGYVGSTGLSTGNHVHFELFFDGTRIDPYPFLMLGALDAEKVKEQ